MRWADEEWIKLYTRDTPDFLSLSFEAQAFFVLLLRKVDRAGLLPLGKRGRASIFLAIGQAHRVADLTPALDELIADGCILVDERRQVLVVRNYAEAQTARASDAARKRAERARDSAEAAKSAILGENCHTLSRDVTRGHAPSHDVTRGHEERREEESRADERSAEEGTAVAAAPAPPAASGSEQRKRPRRTRKLRPLPPVITELRAILGEHHPDAAWDELARRLDAGDLTPDDALAIARWAVRDEFWSKPGPSTLYRQKHWPDLLGKARAGPPKPAGPPQPTIRKIRGVEEALRT